MKASRCWASNGTTRTGLICALAVGIGFTGGICSLARSSRMRGVGSAAEVVFVRRKGLVAFMRIGGFEAEVALVRRGNGLFAGARSDDDEVVCNSPVEV